MLTFSILHILVHGYLTISPTTSTFEVLNGIFYTRRQFPLMLAFALTVHKAQGFSLRTAIVDAGSTCFGTGMLYVALSRVTALNGLHLVELDAGKIKCDEKAAAEYERLRQKFAFRQESNSTTSTQDRTWILLSHCSRQSVTLYWKWHWTASAMITV